MKKCPAVSAFDQIKKFQKNENHPTLFFLGIVLYITGYNFVSLS